MLSEAEFEKLIEIARLAPSVHNTQPWIISTDRENIEVRIDKGHKLGPGDPTGRQTIISLGIFSEAINLAAEEIGFKMTETKLSNDKVILKFKKDKPKVNEVKFIKKRATDRSIYEKVVIDKAAEGLIKKSWSGGTLKIWVMKDESFMKELAEFTSKGIRLALSNPEFRKELSDYLVLPWSGKKRGIAVWSLYIPAILAFMQPLLLKFGFNTGQEAKLERKRWLSASAVILITTDGDLHEDWFEAGRAYLRVSLAVEKLGLSQATSAATVEAATFHEDVEKMLGTNQRLQAVLRIGKGVKNRRYSPRLSTKELIT